MPGVLRRSLLFALLFACAAPARAADPVLMFLIGVARELAAQAKPAPVAAEPIPDTYPGTTVEPALLRRLIDDSFLYLSDSQRTEIFDALHAELMKPGNFAVRASMIEFFAHRALEVRAAQLRLAQLSYREKQLLADEFRQELKLLPEGDVDQLRSVIERGLLPVPADLRGMLLTELDRR